MKMAIAAVLLSMASAPALAATFVYVSNAEDGKVGEPIQVIPTARPAR